MWVVEPLPWGDLGPHGRFSSAEPVKQADSSDRSPRMLLAGGRGGAAPLKLRVHACLCVCALGSLAEDLTLEPVQVEAGGVQSRPWLLGSGVPGDAPGVGTT